MFLNSIANGMCAVTFNAHECTLLHAACHTAGGTLIREEEKPELLQLEAISAAFKAMAIAGYAQWEMNAGQLTRLEEQLQTGGLQPPA